MPDTLDSVGFEFISDAAVPGGLIEQAREQARAIGYAQGWSQGVQKAVATQAGEAAAAHSHRELLLAAYQQQAASALQALQNAAADVRESTLRFTDELEDRILAAAVDIAEALLGRALANPELAAPAALARVLQLAPANEPITVWLNPADHETLTGPNGDALISSVEGATGRGIAFETDPGLQVGDAVARCASTTIDARICEGVTRLREYLSR